MSADEIPRLVFERQRDVEPLAALVTKPERSGFETVRGREDLAVGNILSRRARKRGVDGVSISVRC